jgi:hypothetical protein
MSTLWGETRLKESNNRVQAVAICGGAGLANAIAKEEPQKKSSMEIEFNYLESNTLRLEQATTDLIEKLRPIIIDRPVNTKPQCPGEIHSILSGNLQGINERLDAVLDKIITLKESIDL